MEVFQSNGDRQLKVTVANHSIILDIKTDYEIFAYSIARNITACISIG